MDKFSDMGTIIILKPPTKDFSVNQNQLRLAFFVFRLVVKKNQCIPGGEYILLVKRGDYLGFPGGPIGHEEDVSICATRALSPIASIVSLGKPVQIIGGPCEWDGKPATFDLFSLPGSDIVAPINSGAFCGTINDDRSFDIFVETFKKVLHKSVEIGQVQASAA